MKRTRIVFFLIIGAVVAFIAFSLSSQDSSTASATATAQSLEKRYQKGVGYINLERWEEAKQELEIVFETDPTYKDVQVQLKEVQDQIALLRPAAPVLGSVWTRPEDGAVMVYAPGGSFEMGSRQGEGNEQPIHTVTLDGFWLDQSEVSNTQYAAFVNTQGNQSEGGVPWLDLADEDGRIQESGGRYQAQEDYADRPAVEVSWYGANAYCQWVGGRLPTEAEWEYAARGPAASVYPWGDGAPGCSKLNYADCLGDASAVGYYPLGASWCGALDLAGNAWEWVGDWYQDDYYSVSPTSNPAGPTVGTYKVVRGGGWSSAAGDVRSAYRLNNAPANSNNDLGFRCVIP